MMRLVFTRSIAVGPKQFSSAHGAEGTTALTARFAAAGRAALARSGRFAVAVSPAALTVPFVAALGTVPLAAERFWRATHLFLSDTWLAEGVAPRAIAQRLPVPAGALHLDAAEHANPLTAAAAYEQELRGFFSARAGTLPRFDLIVVALGADGRLGGLVPGGRALDEIERIAAADFDPGTGRYFVTLTPPVIRNAAGVFVVVQHDSAAALRRRIAGEERLAERDPVQVLRAAAGDVTVVAAATDSPSARHAAGEAATHPEL
jgi:6-phosphogluconolactonase/glucosamine-6-phosphate isomerase/deaminase